MTREVGADLLGAIVAATRRTVELRRTRDPLDLMAAAADRRCPEGDRFVERLSRPSGLNVIAECKRRSPSRGVLRADYDLSLIHISEPTRLGMISYAVFCLKKKKK